MTRWLGRLRPAKAATMSALAVVLIGATQVALSSPAFAQDTLAEQRLRKMEAEIRALQRSVFPGGDGKFFSPEITPGQPAAQSTPAVPASTPVTDLLTRMDTLEAQVAKLTAQIEQNQNRLGQIEARLPPVAVDPTAAAVAPQIPGQAPGLTPGTPVATTPLPIAAPTPVPASAPTPRPAARTAATSAPAAIPTPQRVAAVRGVEKPATGDAPEDEYNYGFRLWEAKLYPEAQQQLKMFVDRYPSHTRISFARNLLGRAYLDDGKPREAATWFLQNYQSNKSGARSADSLLLLGESMRQLKDTSRACIALAEFADTYAAEAAGRLKGQYDATRNAVKCPAK